MQPNLHKPHNISFTHSRFKYDHYAYTDMTIINVLLRMMLSKPNNAVTQY